MNPTSLLRTRASSRSFIDETSLPFNQYSPSSGVSRQPIMFINVDLPEPEGTTIGTYAPRCTVRSTPRSAWMVSSPLRYWRCRLCVRIGGSIAEAPPKRRQLWHCVRRFAPTLSANAQTYSILDSKMFGDPPVTDCKY